MNNELTMLPLAIGSLPHTEPTDALGLIKEHMGQAPHWPQLPNRSSQETMVNQCAFPLMNLGLIREEGKSLVFAGSPKTSGNTLRIFPVNTGR